MTITTVTTNTGLITMALAVPIGSSVTLNPATNASAYVEYSTSGQRLVDNGSATWNRWDLDLVWSLSSDMPNYPCFARLVSSVAGATMTVDTAPTTDPNNPFNQVIVPLTGDVVQMVDDSRNGTTAFMHPSTIAALTLALPAIANCKPNQYRNFYFDKAVSGITYTGGTVKNGPSSASAGDLIRLQFVTAAGGINTWAKLK